MSIYAKVRAVETVFRRLEKELASFQHQSGMYCLPNCGKCCTKPDINATVLEFLPLAYHLFKKGEALSWYERLKEDAGPVCTVLSAFRAAGDRGFCSQYAHRGLICRLFGFSAQRDKHGVAKLVTCQTIKTELPVEYEKGVGLAEANQIVFMRDYYYRLNSIDPRLGSEFLPINQAIRKALETVMAYYSYRRIRRAG